MNKKVLIVGECPNHRGNEFVTCKSGKRLAELLGMGFYVRDNEFQRETDRVNLFREHVTSNDWNPVAARMAAEEIAFMARGRIVILCGARVKKAFGFEKNPFLTYVVRCMTRSIFPITYLLIPHPSSRNRMWNDPAMMVEVKEFLANRINKWVASQEAPTTACKQTYSHGPKWETVQCGSLSHALGYVWLCPKHYCETKVNVASNPEAVSKVLDLSADKAVLKAIEKHGEALRKLGDE